MMKTWIMEVTVHMQMRNTFIYELLPKLSLLINANATLASELEYFMHAQKTDNYSEQRKDNKFLKMSAF